MTETDYKEWGWTLAIGGGIYLALNAIREAKKLPPEKEQTQLGSPTDFIGQILPGERDYIKVYLGQKTEALKKFGEGPSFNHKAFPVTLRSYAITEVLEYWTAEINRLCGFKRGGQLGIDQIKWQSPQAPLLNNFIYRGMVSLDSARAIVKGWQRIQPRLQHALLMDIDVSDFSQFSGSALTAGMQRALSGDAAVLFWEYVRELAIVVDVDRAVPDQRGYAWIAILDSAKELPGRIGELAKNIAAEASGIAFDLIWKTLSGFLFSPLGLAVAAGAVWFYRGKLLALKEMI